MLVHLLFDPQVTFRGDGSLGTMQIIADATGNVKGMVSNPYADPPLRPDGKLNVGAAVGRGVLAVVRSLPYTAEGWQTPYTGMVPIKSGEVAEDLNHYLLDSEQTQVSWVYSAYEFHHHRHGYGLPMCVLEVCRRYT
jgi:redox-regulated HSP33 family molecular chaperone